MLNPHAVEDQPSSRGYHLLIGILLIGLIASSLIPSYQPFSDPDLFLSLHNLMELASVVIAVLIFAIGWHRHSHQMPLPLITIATVMGGVGLLDLSHTLSYPGMPDFFTANSTEKAINFWLAARTLAAIGMIVALSLDWQQRAAPAIRFPILITVVLLVALFHTVALIYPEWLPRSFTPDTGLTLYKILHEYLLILLYITAAIILLLRINQPMVVHAPALLASLLIMAMSEFMFTRYTSASDVFNLLGHIYKVIAYLLLYIAIARAAIDAPYHQLNQTRPATPGNTGGDPRSYF
jgi:hypothetical protein